MDDSSPDEVVLVTGGSSGIGAATARRFATDGAAVVLAARDESALSATADELAESDGPVLTVPTDVTDPEAVSALFDATLDRFGRLDAAVVSAGVGEQRDVPLPELPLEQFERVTETNVHGAYYTARAALPALRETGGTLVFIGSYKGKYPSTSTPVYAASKWWLRGFAASLAGRVGPDGVAVSLINPSGVPTAFGSEFRQETNDEALDPERTITPGDVAAAVRYAVRQDAPAAVAELDRRSRPSASGLDPEGEGRKLR